MNRIAPFLEASSWSLPTTRRLFGDVKVSPFDDVRFIQSQMEQGTEPDLWPGPGNIRDPLGIGGKVKQGFTGLAVLVLMALLGIGLVVIGTYSLIKK